MFFKKIIECFFVWHIPSDSEDCLEKADVLIGQSFGNRPNNDPGKSNKELARIAKRVHEKYGVPLVLQWEIADCINDVSKAGVVRKHQEKNKYLDTYEVIVQSKDICERSGWRKAIILAHPQHCWRCVMTAKKLGLDTLVVATKKVPYDHLSDQIWTRNVWIFIPRELISRLFYLLTGKI